MTLPPQSLADVAPLRHRWVSLLAALSRGPIGKLLITVALIAAARLIRGLLPWTWVTVVRLGLGVALAIYLATLTTRLRNVAIVLASILLSLAAIETYMLVVFPPAPGFWPANLLAEHPVLGWAPPHPGVFHHSLVDLKTEQPVYDVTYTIGADLLRKVDSGPNGPAVAFFGDSFMFGQGLPDADTLPQAFADATSRQIRVLNLGMLGYGASQFLRVLETGMYGNLLTPARLFVFQGAPWLAEREVCKASFVPLYAPRYRLVGGRPEFIGTCSHWWSGFTRALLNPSATYRAVASWFDAAGPADIDLYVAILVRAGELARERYGVPTAILYLPYPDYARQAGTTDAAIMQRLRDGGLIVIDGTLDPSAFPGQPLLIPGDGHPTAVANRARALLVRDALGPSLRPSD